MSAATAAGTSRRAPASGWRPDPPEIVVPVLGCCGSAAATTVAVAIATAAGRPARVVECASVTSSGLAGASITELGVRGRVWARGTRDDVVIERVIEVLSGVSEIPCPATADAPIELTVVDVGWEIGQVLNTPGWVADLVRASQHLVLATTATVPGIRRLEGASDALQGTERCAAVLGPRRAKWPRSVQYTAGPAVRRLDHDGALFSVPHDRSLASDGLTTDPLPRPLLTMAHHLLRQVLNHDVSERAPQ